DTGVINNVQPLAFHSLEGSTAIAHNGNIMNADKLRRDLEQEGSILQSSSDTEVRAHLSRKKGHLPMEEAMVAVLKPIVGAYGPMILTEICIYVALDPRHIHALSLGELGDAYVVVSETCAIHIVGARLVRQVRPCEPLSSHHGGLKST